MGWRRVGATPQIGPLQFLSDGGFQFVGTGAVFAKNNRLSRCYIGPETQLDFGDGKARLEIAGKVHRLRFVGEGIGWEYRMGDSSGVAQWVVGTLLVLLLLGWLFGR
jgi:hypothetical protein